MDEEWKDIQLQSWKTIRIKKTVGGCGHIYCLFLLNDEGGFHRLEIKGATRSVPCAESWIQPMSKMLTFSLRRALWEGREVVQKGILKHMKGHRCNNVVPNKDRTCSCSDAIAKCVEEFLDNYEITQKKEKEVHST